MSHRQYPRNHLHAGTRELFLTIFSERWKALAQVPIRGMQQPQHDVPGFDWTILNEI